MSHPITAKYIFSSSIYRTYTKIDYNFDHKKNLNKFKIIEIIWNVFSIRNEIKLEISNRKIRGRTPNTWELYITLLSNP